MPGFATVRDIRLAARYWLVPCGTIALLLSACGGGGGGGGSSTPAPQPARDTTAPVLTGVGDTATNRGEAFDPVAGVTASDNVDGNVTSSIMTTGAAVDVNRPGAYTVTYSVSDAAGNNTTVNRVVTVVVPPGLPDVAAETVFSHYFDIASGSGSGTEVVGRINLERNRNVAASPIPDDYSFAIIEDDSGGMFELRGERGGDGRLFGVLRVADGKEAQSGSYALRVEMRQDATVLARFAAPVNVVERTQWEIYHERAVDFVSSKSRLTGRENYSDAEVTAWIAELEEGDGAFEGMSFYAAATETEWLAIGTATLTDELEQAANRIGGLGKAYLRSDTYGPSGEDADRDRLRNAIYLALIAYVDHFPLNDFANFEGVGYGHRTHQWLFSDPIGGAAVLVYADFIEDMNDGVQRAGQARERLFRFLQHVNFDLLWRRRQPDDRRYYLPEWQPSGSFADLKVWLETNARFARRFAQSGLLPDGTISHHVGQRQDIAFWAYGLPWMTGTSFDAVALLADTRWKISNAPFDRAADFLLFAYPRILYKDGIDFQAVGRSHYAGGTRDFGSDVLAGGIENILDARSTDTVVSRELELTDLQTRMVDRTHEASGNTAFWANDYMIHRSGGEVGEQPYYMSVKMQSARTRGAESISQSNGIHNGSGVLLVKVDGDEYNDSRFRWDWHALPGVTEELRTDRTPRQSDSNLFNPDHFAGTASNGRYGFAAFRYSSDDAYTSAAANKGYFFVKDYALALGNGVRRVRNTDGSDAESIITTVDQAAWNTALTYRLDGAAADVLVLNGSTVDTSLEITGPSWFHQDRIGYVILADVIVLANGELFADHIVNVLLRAGDAVIDSDPGDTDDGHVFHIAIDHGTAPDGTGAKGQYAYVVVPNVAAADMPGVMTNLLDNQETINTGVVQGHRYADGTLDLVQLAFYSAGTASFADGLTVTADKPALVQLHRVRDGWNIAVQDPTHHADTAAIASSEVFEHILLPGANQIAVDVNLRLRPGVYMYDTQGTDVRFVAGQTADVTDRGDGASRVTVNLPDGQDSFGYAYREELYAGMPAVVNIP